MKLQAVLTTGEPISEEYLNRHVYFSPFSVGDKVKIDGGDLTGVVIDLSWRGGTIDECHMIEVAWFANGDPKSYWFHSRRVSLIQ